MNERRQSRVFTPPRYTEAEYNAAPPVLPSIVEHLVEKFPLGVLRIEGGGGLDGAVDTAILAAEMRGREDVISYLHTLSERTITHGRPA